MGNSEDEIEETSKVHFMNNSTKTSSIKKENNHNESSMTPSYSYQRAKIISRGQTLRYKNNHQTNYVTELLSQTSLPTHLKIPLDFTRETSHQLSWKLKENSILHEEISRHLNSDVLQSKPNLIEIEPDFIQNDLSSVLNTGDLERSIRGKNITQFKATHMRSGLKIVKGGQKKNQIGFLYFKAKMDESENLNK